METYQANNFEVLRLEMGITNREFAAILGVREQVYSRIKKGEYPIGLTMKTRIQNAFPQVQYDWLLYGKGERNELGASHSDTISMINVGNGKSIGYFSNDVKFIDENKNNIFFEVSPGRYLMQTKLVTEKAKAGYLSGFSDAEYMDDLPAHFITVNEFHKGAYRSFEVSGDSMTDGTDASVLDGDIVTGRLIKRELWQSKFHTHKYRYWVIVHRYEGVIIKEIAYHDVTNGILTLRSLNLDKATYPDFEVSLDDVDQIFNVVDISRSL
ncbi:MULTISPECIES: helix-turn-helix domain-containing protein [unclassified Sphingobacterium]|uniref:helix-turn-helix domain-containing protein n=1 Tax=unclassified Sphingobacterium TaxID=2609468 RepID=UPI0025ECF071|nr:MULTISPECIES: helix-turn-helix domain-containing protein [unclassified Sphingobacterium]